MARVVLLVALSISTLTGTNLIPSRAAAQDDAARAGAVQRLLTDVCLPLVVDGVPEATVAKESGLQRFTIWPSLGSNLSHSYVFYRSNLSGHPIINISDGYCSVRLRGRYSELLPTAVSIALSTRGAAAYPPESWSPTWQGVVEAPNPPTRVVGCVKGARSARIVASTPEFSKRTQEFDVDLTRDQSGRFYCPRE